MESTVKKSIAAGLLIGIANMANILIENKYLGAFVFSLALLTILRLDLYLFTGKVGFYDIPNKPNLLTVILGNSLGITTMTLISVFAKFSLLEEMKKVAIYKFSNGFIPIFCLAFLCGICMQIAVQSRKTIIVVLSIVIFVLCGFEHCIADVAFLMVCPIRFSNYIKFALIVLGNSLGAITFRFLTKSEEIKQK